MQLKPLGKTSAKIPELGAGTWNYTGGSQPLRRAIALGAAFIDTAEHYQNEAVVGAAISGLREQVFLATKVSPDHFRRDDVIRAAERSLKLLKTDRIDLYQLHWPSRDVPIEETIGAMEQLVDAGKIRFIGVSNFGKRLLEAAVKASRKHGITANQMSYSLINREVENEILPYCIANRITLIAYSPLATGLANITANDPARALGRVAAETRKTEAQVALNWCIRHPSVVAVFKANSVSRIEENCGASGWKLTDAQIETLNTVQTQRESKLERLARRSVGSVLRALRLR
jgi:diketogulonate reductase-like aldo/keto reductase